MPSLLWIRLIGIQAEPDSNDLFPLFEPSDVLRDFYRFKPPLTSR